jgi:pyruvate/2-oxoglutarate dehydrogenase complex dihydrolipoamide acyltransferase (E2) component
MLSFNAAADGSYSSQPNGYNSTGKDGTLVLPGSGDARIPQQQQQRRLRQQQRRRRQRAAAASDDDSDYLAAEDDEDSADYELSDDGYSYEERLPAHRSARAPRGFSAAAPAAAAAASGSGGAQQYPQQLPQFYKSQRWSPAEHAKLVELVAKHGLRNWAVVASELPGRNGKQCRERYLTHSAKAKRVSPGCSVGAMKQIYQVQVQCEYRVILHDALQTGWVFAALAV